MHSDALTTSGSKVEVGPALGLTPHPVALMRDYRSGMLSAGYRQCLLDSQRAIMYKNAHGTGKGIGARRWMNDKADE